MNQNAEKLMELKNALRSLEREHRDILNLEPTIARPLHVAADEAKRRVIQITEGKPPHQGFVP